MEAQTDIQTYLERGKAELAQGHGRAAAIAYAHGAQMEPANPMVHLGLAEANLALGNYGVVQVACRRVQELQPESGIESRTAQALLDLLDRRYERALQNVDGIISQDPGIAYLHAMRSYLLRATGQDYDANLARARAARLSYGGHFDNCFPPLEASYASGYKERAIPAPPQDVVAAPGVDNSQSEREREGEQVPMWSRPNRMQRQVIRTRFMLSRYPSLVTYTLIGLNVIVFILSMLFPAIMNFGVQQNDLVLQGQYWRIFTAMFLHDNILSIGLNMLSLFFIGRPVELFFGRWRYLVIYLLSGIVGGVAFLLLSPGTAALGAAGAIFGVFGALGVFYIVNRNSLGVYGRGAIGNWLFWLGLNLVFDFAPGSDIAVWAHIGCLLAGVVLAFLLDPRLGRRRA